MRNLRHGALPLLFIVTSALVVPQLKLCAQEKEPAAENVSIINLIATPERYNNMLVAVCGFLSIEQENDALYLSKEDYDNMITRNAVWVTSKSSDERKRLGKFDKKYVMLIARYRSDIRGSSSMFFGGLEVEGILAWGRP